MSVYEPLFLNIKLGAIEESSPELPRGGHERRLPCDWSR